MATCSACEQLLGKLSDTVPHERLKKIGAQKHKAYGMATGQVEFYQCQECGTKLSRDCDSKDRFANWARAH